MCLKLTASKYVTVTSIIDSSSSISQKRLLKETQKTFLQKSLGLNESVPTWKREHLPAAKVVVLGVPLLPVELVAEGGCESHLRAIGSLDWRKRKEGGGGMQFYDIQRKKGSASENTVFVLVVKRLLVERVVLNNVATYRRGGSELESNLRVHACV